jgi:hypothetical protein
MPKAPMLKNLIRGSGAPCAGALDLVAEDEAFPRVDQSAFVAADRDVVAAPLGLEGDPVRGNGAAHEADLFLAQPEQDRVADVLAFFVAHEELLGLHRPERGEAVDGHVAEQAPHAGAFEVDIGHVALLEQHGGLMPGLLFVLPGGELGLDRKGVGAGVRATQHAHRPAGLVDLVLKAFDSHVSSLPRWPSAARWRLRLRKRRYKPLPVRPSRWSKTRVPVSEPR